MRNSRRNQRGFIYLVTGANGAGKTLFTLKECHERAQRESRPVCYNGRFIVEPDGPLKYWKKIDAKDWQAEPDGTLFFFDEAHNDFPLRGGRDAPPKHVVMLAEHRVRGFDFYLLTQHPMNLDNFVRRLIGSPGWHRHLKRAFGSDLVSQLEWASVNPQCEKAGSGESGSVTMLPFPKEVFTWYKSASLHTGKTKIPRLVWVALACALMVPVLGYVAYASFTKPGSLEKQAVAAKAPGTTTTAAQRPAAPPTAQATVQDFLIANTPRVEGFQYTAPKYDGVTQAIIAPYPAACIDGFNRRKKLTTCECYTQQGTRLQVPVSQCKQIAENGFFIDWKQEQPSAPPAVKTVDARSELPPPPMPSASAPDRSPRPPPDRQSPDSLPSKRS